MRCSDGAHIGKASPLWSGLLACVFCGVVECLCPVTSHADEFLAQIPDRGLVPCLKDYCDRFSIGRVVTEQAALRSATAAEKQSLGEQRVKAHKLIDDLRLITQQLRRADISVSDKTTILELLSDLSTKVANGGDRGSGNIELECVLSMMSAGVYLSTCSDWSSCGGTNILMFPEPRCEQLTPIVVRKALEAESCSAPSVRTNETLHHLVVDLILESNETPINGSPHESAAIEVLMARKLMDRAHVVTVADQLDNLDKKILAWDIFRAIKWRALCRLAVHTPRKRGKHSPEARLEFCAFRSALSNSLSGVELDVVNSGFPVEYTPLQRDVRLLGEVRDLISSKGAPILTMVYSRLAKANE